MNTNLYPIRAVFFTKNRLIGEQLFPGNFTIGQLKKYFLDNLSDGTTFLYNSYFLNSMELLDSDLICHFFLPDQNSKLLEIVIAIELKENEENLINSKEDKHQIFSKIIQPKENPFGLIVFFPQNNKIQFEEYPYEYIQKNGLNSSNIHFTYCNSPHALFLSGAEKHNLPYNDFWIINHRNYAISRKKMEIEKKNHSMIYVPNWGSGAGSIFIVGGNILQTVVYDVRKGILYYWGNMLDIHIKPALFIYGDYLYCFNSLNEKNNFFEKTYLGNNTRKIWEKVYPRFRGVNPKDFYNNDFAVSKSIDNSILFIGGKNANKNTFVFNPLNNTISRTEGDNVNIIFEDKNFYKINNLIDISIPSNFEKNQELALLNKYDYSLIKIKYKVGQKNSNNNLTSSIESIHELYTEKNQKGNISLQGKFLSLNQKKSNNFFLRILGKPIFSQINKWKSVKMPHRYISYQQNVIINWKNVNNQYGIQKNNINNQKTNKKNIINNQHEIQRNNINNLNEIQMNNINNQNGIKKKILIVNKQQIKKINNNQNECNFGQYKYYEGIENISNNNMNNMKKEQNKNINNKEQKYQNKENLIQNNSKKDLENKNLNYNSDIDNFNMFDTHNNIKTNIQLDQNKNNLVNEIKEKTIDIDEVNMINRKEKK